MNHAIFQVYIYSQLNLQWGKSDIYAQYDSEQKKKIGDDDCYISAPHIVGCVIGYNWMRIEKETIMWQQCCYI